MLISVESTAWPKNIQHVSNIAYGEHAKQSFDVYMPVDANNAPVIFMVHGGAWKIGDKASKAVVKHKVNRWVERGFIFISINYRMLPELRPLDQAKDVQAALAFAQQLAPKWGGSPDKFILMGHSAGAHLVTLLTTQYQDIINSGVKEWLGTVSIDSAAYNIPQLMNADKPPRFYKKAFGNNPSYWNKSSPYQTLSGKLSPFLAICSLQRNDKPCQQASDFITKAKKFGTQTMLLKVDLSHRESNVELGKNTDYTASVERFMETLQPDIL